MSRLIKQLRVSLLVTLGMSAFDLVTDILDGLSSGTLVASLGDWALNTVLLCALVAVLHTAIYGAAHIGRPEGREARGVRAGLVVLLLLDLGFTWPLWTRAADHSGALFVAGCVVVALMPLLTTTGVWGWTRLRGLGADAARNRALFFGILTLLPQLLAAATLVAVA
ncbi:hypothetical protein ABZY09_45575 [Streptomyces sp. NPDC002928]|uniref:hypothetical protein n=1 Tax=Streptomyces sp. NPDC002928 TaxID=3154440 RepID=UPI0033B0401D